MNAGVGDAEARFRLYRFIDGIAGATGYIDSREEKDVFEKADSMGVWKGQTEAMLNHRCKRHSWTRETEVIHYVRIMLEKACAHGGKIRKADFDQVVDFASAVRMPRKHAIRLCCALIKKFQWKPVADGLLDSKDWLNDYEA